MAVPDINDLAAIRSFIGTKAAPEADPNSRHQFYRTKEVPRTATSSEGIYVALDDGSVVIDGMGGAAVSVIGHGRDEVVAAMAEQAKKLSFVYGVQYTNPAAEELANFLIDESKGVFQTVAFLSGGTEANESAMKMARQYWVQQGQPQRTKFIGRHMSYHGNTIAALSLGLHPGRRGMYAPLCAKDVFYHVSAANYSKFALPGESELDMSKRLAEELEAKILELGPDTVAMFCAEPMVGTSQGCTVAPEGYWPLIKGVCDKYDVLLCLDEVMSGMWRVGSMFAYEELCEGVTPDLLSCAKGLGSGYVPIGAMFASPRVAEGIKAGAAGTSGMWNHGFTYTGHPVSCAGALAVQTIVKEEKLGPKVLPAGRRLSARMRKGLMEEGAPLAGVVSDVRGHGLFWAVEYDVPADMSPRFVHRVHAKALELGLVTLPVLGTTDAKDGEIIHLAPHYICTEAELDAMADVVIEASEAAYAEWKAETKA